MKLIKAYRTGASLASTGLGTYSGGSERRAYTYVRALGWWVQLNWSPLQPQRRWRDLTHHVGKPGYKWLKPNEDGTYGYHEAVPREYSVALSDGYLHVHYGLQEDNSICNKSLCYAVPFLNWRFWRHSLYKTDGTLYAHVENNGYHAPYPKWHKLRDSVPKAYYMFRDYDGEVIQARCFIEEREWRFGTKWASFLSWFVKPKVSTTIDIQFSKEVGPRKGSWKGGTLGHGGEYRKGERIQSAFVRYCYHNKLEFMGTCEPWQYKHETQPDERPAAENKAQ